MSAAQGSPEAPPPEPMELYLANWRNRVPVRLTLAPDNISSPAALKPLYMLVPRLGYLSTIALQAWPQLQHVLPAVPGRATPRPWFDSDGLPLKWWLPCGVIFDLLAQSPHHIPWLLQIHYTPLPEVLLGWDNGASSQAMYFHSLKEACHICKGPEGSNAVMRMSGAAQDALWAAVDRGDGPAAAAALAALRIQPSPRQGQPANIPVRLLLRPASCTSSSGLWEATGGGVFSTSRPMPMTTPAGETSTLATMLALLLPALFPSSSSSLGGPSNAVSSSTAPSSSNGGNASSNTSNVASSGVNSTQQQGQQQGASSDASSGQAAGSAGVSSDSGAAGAGEASGNAASAATPSEPLTTSQQGQQQQQQGGGAASTSDVDVSQEDGGSAVAIAPSLPADASPAAAGAVAAAITMHHPLQASSTTTTTSNSMETQTSPSQQPQVQAPPPQQPQQTQQQQRAPVLAQRLPVAGQPGWPVAKVLVGGIEMPLEAPLAWLHTSLHAADMFLYVVVRLDPEALTSSSLASPSPSAPLSAVATATTTTAAATKTTSA